MKDSDDEEQYYYWEIRKDEIKAEGVCWRDMTAVSTLETDRVRVNSMAKSVDALSTQEVSAVVGSTKSFVKLISIVGQQVIISLDLVSVIAVRTISYYQ